jgi:hypothetical protein
MRTSSSRVAIVSFLATVCLLLFRMPQSHANECLASSELVLTSQVAVQVFGGLSRLAPLEGVDVSLHWEGRSAVPTATGKTDSQGHLRVQGVPPGRYRVQAGFTESGSQTLSIQVVPASAAPARLIAISLVGGIGCSEWCLVAGTSGPLARAPRCLERTRP